MFLIDTAFPIRCGFALPALSNLTTRRTRKQSLKIRSRAILKVAFVNGTVLFVAGCHYRFPVRPKAVPLFYIVTNPLKYLVWFGEAC